MNTTKLVDFGSVIKKAWQYTWKYKYLWFLGILTGGGFSGGGNNINYLINSGSENQNWQNIFHNHAVSSSPIMGKILGATDYSISTGFIVFMSLLGLILAIALIYLQITARGAIITAVDKLDQNQHFTLGNSWHAGHKYFWRIFLFTLLLVFIILVPLAFLFTPVAIMASLRWYIPAVIVGIIFALIFVVYAIYIALIVQFGERILVLEDKGPWQSIIIGEKFFRKNWKNVLLTYLINMAVAMLAGIVVVIACLIVVGLLFGIVYGIYTANSTAAIVVAIPLGLAVLIALMIIGGIISAYQSSILTLAYKEIKNIA